MYMVLCCHLCRSTCKVMCLQMQPIKGWSNIFWMNVTYVEWCSICFWQLQVDSLSQPMLLERAVGGVRRCCRWIDKNAKLTFITYGSYQVLNFLVPSSRSVTFYFVFFLLLLFFLLFLSFLLFKKWSSKYKKSGQFNILTSSPFYWKFSFKSWHVLNAVLLITFTGGGKGGW